MYVQYNKVKAMHIIQYCKNKVAPLIFLLLFSNFIIVLVIWFMNDA